MNQIVELTIVETEQVDGALPVFAVWLAIDLVCWGVAAYRMS